MLVVSVARTWPLVLSGATTAEVATGGAWPVRVPAELDLLDEHADVVVGIFQERVVSAFDIVDHRWETNAERAAALEQGLRRDNPRVIFEVVPSETWGALIGTPNPGRPFTGDWPVQYLATAEVSTR